MSKQLSIEEATTIVRKILNDVVFVEKYWCDDYNQFNGWRIYKEIETKHSFLGIGYTNIKKETVLWNIGLYLLIEEAEKIVSDRKNKEEFEYKKSQALRGKYLVSSD